MHPGRNDLCPCGSGRKFKRCCGASDPTAPVRVTDDDRVQAYELFDRLSHSPRIAADLALATDLMAEGDTPSPLDDPDDEVQLGWFLDWFAFDFLLRPAQTTLAAEALRAHAGELTLGARRFIQTMRDAPLRLLQVQTAFRFAGALCKDQLDPHLRFRVVDGDIPFDRHAVFVARLAERAGCWAVEGDPCFLDLVDRRQIVRRLLKVRRETMAAGASPALQRMIEGAALLRVMAMNEALLDGEIETAEGDPLDPVTAHFTVVDGDKLKRALADATDFVAHGDSSYTWLHPDAAKKERYALGHLLMSADWLEVTAVTPQRAERLRARLDDLAGGAVRFTRLQRSRETETGASGAEAAELPFVDAGESERD
jgi:hypothetical protein